MWLGSSYRFLLWGFFCLFVFSVPWYKLSLSGNLDYWTNMPEFAEVGSTYSRESLELLLPPLGSCSHVFYLLTTQHHAVIIDLRYYHILKVPCSHQVSLSSWHLHCPLKRLLITLWTWQLLERCIIWWVSESHVHVPDATLPLVWSNIRLKKNVPV